MADITMSLNDTLELDAVIKEWNDPSNIVEDSDGKFNLSGFYTGTRVLDPQESGTHTIKVNGQELTVEVTNPSTIPDSAVARIPFDESTGSTEANDTIGDSSLSEQTGGSWVPDTNLQGGYGLQFDGSDDWWRGDYISEWDNATHWTLCFTLDLNNTSLDSSFGETITANRFPTQGSFTTITTEQSAQGHIAWDIKDSSSNYNNSIPVTTNFNGYVRICLIHDPENNVITPYVNTNDQSNNKTGSSANQAANSLNSGKFVVGGDGSNHTKCLVDDLILYDKSLNSSEINADYQAQPWS